MTYMGSMFLEIAIFQNNLPAYTKSKYFTYLNPPSFNKKSRRVPVKSVLKGWECQAILELNPATVDSGPSETWGEGGGHKRDSPYDNTENPRLAGTIKDPLALLKSQRSGGQRSVYVLANVIFFHEVFN